MAYRRILSVALICGSGLMASMAEAADQQVTLMLGGASCETHAREIRTALKRVEGVRAVDLDSMPGHAVIRTAAEGITPEQLTAAVAGAKGANWHCTAEVMK